MDSEFILVSKRKKRGKKPKISNVGCAYSPTPIECPSDIANCYQRSLANIDECKHEIESSSFWTEFKASWKNLEVYSHVKAEEIISYGAGNISLSPIARYQFAFLALLAETLELTNHVYIYDPVFNLLERRVISNFGFHLITENEECRRKVTKDTVILMLHCGRKMYDNLLQANWNSSSLEFIILIGNAFSSYLERFPSRLLEKEAPYLYDIIPFSTEEVVNNTFVHMDIFNDTSCMTFSKNNLSSVPTDFWTRDRQSNESVRDAEIISKSKVNTFVE